MEDDVGVAAALTHDVSEGAQPQPSRSRVPEIYAEAAAAAAASSSGGAPAGPGRESHEHRSRHHQQHHPRRADGPQKSADGFVLIVTGLHEEATEDNVSGAFDEYGRLVTLNLPLDRASGAVKGYALLEYKTRKEAEAAVAGMNGKEILGQPVEVAFAFLSDWHQGQREVPTSYGRHRGGGGRGGGRSGGESRDGGGSSSRGDGAPAPWAAGAPVSAPLPGPADDAAFGDH